MRMLKLGMWFVSLFAVSIAYAESSPRQSQGMGISYGYQGLALRQVFNENNLLFISADYGKSNYETNFSSGNITTSTSYSSKSYSVGTGARHYLSNEKLSDFVQLELMKWWTNNSYNTSSSGSIVTIGYGLEYYFDAHLSIEARAGLSYGQSKSDSSNSYSQSSASGKAYGFPVVGIAITRYW